MGEDEAILALNMHLCASETESLADTLKHVGFGGSAQHRLIGRVSPTQLGYLVALRWLRLTRTASSQLVMLRRVLADNHIPRLSRRHFAGFGCLCFTATTSAT